MSKTGQLLILLLMLTLVGCQGEQLDSLHESDHVTPVHWPGDLDDAVRKIDERLAILKSVDSTSGPDERSKNAQKELVDIVGWMPEVAADSFISETQWEPVNEASLELSSALVNQSLPLNIAIEQKVLQFRDLLIKTSQFEAKNRPIRSDGPPSNEIVDPDSQAKTTDESES
jgi:hypothetical protein